MYDLILYDTSNFVDFPIGGQLTSIRNFLKYIANEQSSFGKRMLLVGITTNQENVGKISKIEIDGVEFDFLPVIYRNSNLSCVKKSLRLEYLKGLISKRKLIKSEKKTIHYIHTPEAFIEVKMIYPFSKTVVFSHGSFFNMVDGFRFYQNSKLVHWGFNKFIAFLLKKADLIFTLDDVSTKQYLKFTKKVVQVENSIVLQSDVPDRETCHKPIQLLFVGRLSKVKQIDKIIEAMKLLKETAFLTIVGNGEEFDNLQQMITKDCLDDCVKLVGSVEPSQIAEFMNKSDILIMNSIFEGKPMTILEAMSFGMPVVTTPVGGIPEMTISGENAEYTNGKSQEIYDAVLKIANNYVKYRNNAIKYATKYDYKSVNSYIYEEIVKILRMNK